MSFVKICGKRGFVAWCLKCDDWEPTTFVIPAVCGTCSTPFPEVPQYKNRRYQFSMGSVPYYDRDPSTGQAEREGDEWWAEVKLGGKTWRATAFL